MSKTTGTTGENNAIVKDRDGVKAHFMVERLRRMGLKELQQIGAKLAEIQKAANCPYCNALLYAETNTRILFGNVVKHGPQEVYYGCLECVATKAKMLQADKDRPKLYSLFKHVVAELNRLGKWRAQVTSEDKELRRNQLADRVRKILEAESEGGMVSDEAVEKQVRAMLNEQPEPNTQP